MAAERLSIIIPPPSARSGLAAVGPLRGSSRRRCRGACGKVWSSSSSGEATAWQLPQTLTVIQSLISGLGALTWGGCFGKRSILLSLFSLHAVTRMPLVMAKNEYTYSVGRFPVQKVIRKFRDTGSPHRVTKEVEVLRIAQCLFGCAEKSIIKPICQCFIGFIRVIP